ncbi:cytochrome P450 4c21-like isoform X2 [Pectinophora gossypiella]|nr:cytochrome P450 4c21-like isoform X2 [Pectinophora gossypiella]
MHQVFGNGEYLVTVMHRISALMEETGLPFVAWVGPRPVIVVMHPEDVKAVTNAFVEKPYYYNFAREWVGNGLVTAPSHIWKRSIKKLAGTFTGNIVDGYQGVFNAQAKRLVEKLRREVGGEPFDVLHRYLAYTTLETICQTALGVPRIQDNIVTHEYYRAFNRTFELFIERGMNILLHLDFFYRLTPAYRELTACISVLHNVSQTVISKRLKEREEMKRNGILPTTNDYENGKIRFKAFLDILFDLKEADPTLTMQQIQSEVDTIIVGGQETIAKTLFMSLIIIGKNPDIQEKLYAEIKKIFGDSRRAVVKEDLAQMKYCEGVLNETLRLFPPIPFIMRDADRDLPLKSCTIPKGTGCGVNAWGAGRSKKIWGPDAEEYKPERWQDTELGRVNAASFLAFSYGKRACIGKRYAMPIMKTILAYCVRELEFYSDTEQVQFRVDVTMKAVKGHLIQVRLREKDGCGSQ